MGAKLFPPPIRFQQLIAGGGWLVHEGASYVNRTPDLDPTSKFVTEKAPRTAVGFMANGTLISVAVDGVEATDEGPDLFEMAELLVLLGAQEVGPGRKGWGAIANLNPTLPFPGHQPRRRRLHHCRLQRRHL